MTKQIFAIMLSLFAADVALADYFQIFDGSRPYYISYAPVTVGGRPVGYTDRYGRIRIDLDKGEYRGEITYRGRKIRLEFVIDGGRELKRVEAKR